MLSSKTYVPGQEVQLVSGATGVLYAQTWVVSKRSAQNHPLTWYFLPDQVGTSGLVVWGQPRQVSEAEIAEAGVVRAGSWPDPTYRLSALHRQAVYAAHMRGDPLPPP